MLVDGIEDALDRLRQVTIMLAEVVLEELQAIGVHEVVEDHRVVEWLRRKLPVRPGLQRQRAELVLRGTEQALPVIECCARAVGGAQPRGEAGEKIGEHQGISPIRRRLRHRRRIIAAGEEEDGAAVADEVGERFVEVGMPADVAGVVQQLVDDHVRQRGAVVAQQVGQQRVSEPPKRAERYGGADVCIVAVTFQAHRLVFGGAFREVAFVGDSPDDREPPRVRLELQPVRGRHDVHDLVGVDVRDTAVAIADPQV